MTLFQHTHHPYVPRNAYILHKQEQQSAGFNQRLAVGITRASSTMACAYLFFLLALFGFPGLIYWLGPTVALYVVWFSQTMLQLCYLPILSVGQGVIGRQQELQANEAYQTTIKIAHEIEEIIKHMDKQDEELIKHRELLEGKKE
jgi:hypothetical protein